jgi:hypothetical protein
MAENDPEILKRRLEKALSVAEKIKKKQVFESEVNKELARRIDQYKKDCEIYEQTISAVKSGVMSLDVKLQHVLKPVGA